MAFDDLGRFLDMLEKDGKLLRISEEVDPHLEITRILDRAVKEGGPAVLSEKVKGSRIKIAGNLLGSHGRMLKALGLKDYAEIDERLSAMMDIKAPQGLLDKLKMLPELAEISS